MKFVSSRIEKIKKGKKMIRIGIATYLCESDDDLKLVKDLIKKPNITFDYSKRLLSVQNEL